MMELVQNLAQEAAVTDAHALNAARMWASAAAILGLAGFVIGALGLSRTNDDDRGSGAVWAVAAGIAASVIGALNLLIADGGPGTGNGVVGGVIALALGAGAVILGGLAKVRAGLRRSR